MSRTDDDRNRSLSIGEGDDGCFGEFVQDTSTEAPHKLANNGQ